MKKTQEASPSYEEMGDHLAKSGHKERTAKIPRRPRTKVVSPQPAETADTADCEAFCTTASVKLHLRLLREEQGVVEGDDEPAHRG